MKQYAIARVVGGVLFAGIFVGWMVIQWSSIAMRFVGAGLIVLTAWVTASSILADARRMRDRQVAWDVDAMIVTTQAGASRVRMNEIFRATWSANADDFGLSFYDRTGRPLARLDENILADEGEARVFLRWLRTRTQTNFEVTWKG